MERTCPACRQPVPFEQVGEYCSVCGFKMSGPAGLPGGGFAAWICGLWPDGSGCEQVERVLGLYRCRKCGYSLIGNTSGICPECGTQVAAPASGSGGG
jgi:predicted amidophosphoribosyltransferase